MSAATVDFLMSAAAGAVASAGSVGMLCGFVAGVALAADWSQLPCVIGIHNFDFHPDDEAHAYGRHCWDCGKCEAAK